MSHIQLAEGQFVAKVFLKRQLDFESRSSFRLGLKAEDGAPENQLSAMATVSIDILDVQDQPPVFVNAPYSATVPENTLPVRIKNTHRLYLYLNTYPIFNF